MKKSTFLIWLLILADLVSGLLQVLQVPFFRLGLILKGVIILFLFTIYLIRLKDKSYSSLYASMMILFVFWVIGSSISLFIDANFDYTNSLIVLNRYFFFLILACAFLDWSRNESFEKECKNIFEGFLIINNSSIFIGFAFGIDIFSTYDPYGEFGSGARFGYKGLIFGQNAVAAIYTLGIAYLFRENLRDRRQKLLLLLTTCLASLLVGTKATWFTLLLLGVYYLYFYRIKTLLFLIFPALAGLLFLVINNWSYLQENFLFFIIQKYETMDFYTFWTSNRNSLLINSLDFMSTNWIFVNYLTGDGSLYVEMDFFDLYFFFGLGAMIYLFIYVKIFFFKDYSRDNKYFFLVWMAMSFIAGHIINSAIVPLFFLIYVFSASNSKKNVNTFEAVQDKN